MFLLLLKYLFVFSLNPSKRIYMMVRVALGNLPGGLKVFRDVLLNTGDHHLEVTS